MHIFLHEYRSWTHEQLSWVSYLTSVNMRFHHQPLFATVLWWCGLPFYWLVTRSSRVLHWLNREPPNSHSNAQFNKLLANQPGLPRLFHKLLKPWNWFWYILFTVFLVVKWLLIVVPLFVFIATIPLRIEGAENAVRKTESKVKPNKKRTAKKVISLTGDSITFDDVRARIRELQFTAQDAPK